MMRGTVCGASRLSIGCCSRTTSVSLEPRLVMDVWLELLRAFSLLLSPVLFSPVLTLTNEGAANPPNKAR